MQTKKEGDDDEGDTNEADAVALAEMMARTKKKINRSHKQRKTAAGGKGSSTFLYRVDKNMHLIKAQCCYKK